MMTVQALQLLLEFAPRLLQLQCSLLAHASLSRAKRVVACQFTHLQISPQYSAAFLVIHERFPWEGLL